jgi:ABC-type bacteriocin/lantibiotic exporter with double-glycine peptidase domain
MREKKILTKFNPEIEQIFKPLRKMQLLAIILTTGVLVFRLLVVIEIQKIVDGLSTFNLEVLQMQLKKSLIMILAFFLINYIFQYIFRNLQYNSHYILIEGLFGISLKKEYSFYEKYVPSAILSMLKDDSKFIADWKSIGIVTIFLNILTVIFVFAIMSTYHLIFTLVIIFIIIFCFIITRYVSKMMGEKIYDLQVSNTEINKKIVDYLSGIKDIKQHKEENFFQAKLSNFIKNDTYNHCKAYSKYFSFYMSIFALLAMALPIISVLIGVILVLNGQFTVGKLFATYMLVGNLQEPVMVIPDYLNKRRQAIAIQDKILPLLEKRKKENLQGKISDLKEFTFQSQEYIFGDEKSILKNVKFSLSKNSVILIRGESGKGKTSLLNLLSRFYSTNNQKVEIKYNQIPIETIPISEYYEHVLQAQQTPYIFRDTVLNNVVLGKRYAREDIEEIFHVVCLDEFIEAKGVNYLIEQNGENISGGQRQRIGLARTLLKKPDILLLDEPISALDPELIVVITKRIAEYCEKYKISLIVVSHNDSFERYYEENDNVTIVTL